MSERLQTTRLRDVITEVMACWRSLFVADLLFKAIAVAVLTPLAGILFRGFLWLIGQPVIADTDLALLLLRPLAWPGLIVLSGVALAIVMLEQATVVVVCLLCRSGDPRPVSRSLRLVAFRARAVLWITTEAAARLLATAAPFLLACAMVYGLLLTKYDINYYLTEKPREFLFAAFLLGALLILLAILVVHRLASWSIAIPLAVVERLSARRCLAESRRRVAGQTSRITVGVGVLLVGISALSLLVSAVTTQVGFHVVPLFRESLWSLVTALGFFLGVWAFGHVIVSLLAAAALGALIARVYEEHSDRGDWRLPAAAVEPRQWVGIRWTLGRVVSLVAVGCFASAFAGAAAIESVRSDDAVEITAHRGASGRAP